MKLLFSVLFFGKRLISEQKSYLQDASHELVTKDLLTDLLCDLTSSTACGNQVEFGKCFMTK